MTNRELARTFANFYLRQKDYSKMMEILSDHLEQDPEDAEAWNLLGLASLKANQLPQAKHAFYMASSKSKDEARGTYLYHYADTLALGGEVKKAHDALRLAEQYRSVRSSARHALKHLQSGQPLPEASLSSDGKLYGSVSVAAAYDTNVVLAPDSTVALLSVSDVASPSISPIFSGGYLKPDGDVDWDFGLMGMFSYQVNEPAQDFNTAYAQLRADRRSKIDGMSGRAWNFGFRGDVTFLNVDSFGLFNWNQNVYAGYRIKHNSLAETEIQAPVTYRAFSDAFSQDENDDRSGMAFGLSFIHRRYLGAYQLGATLKYERQQTTGDNFRADQFSLPVTVTRALPFWGLNGIARLEFTYVSYPDNPSDRSDTNVRASLGGSKRFSGRWLGSFDYTFMKNSSTLGAADFTKHVVTMVVTYEL